jgi:hypothetical protein
MSTQLHRSPAFRYCGIQNDRAVKPPKVDRVILAQAPYVWVSQHVGRVEQGALRLAGAGVARRREPEDQRGDQRRDGIDARHVASAISSLQRRRNEEIRADAGSSGPAAMPTACIAFFDAE